MRQTRKFVAKIKKQKTVCERVYEKDVEDGMYNPFVKFPTPEKLHKRLKEFLDYVKKNQVPMTIGRLAWFLGTTSGTITNYGKNWKYADLISDIKQNILACKEERLNTLTGNKTGVIFDLINNHGYRNYAPIPAPSTQDSPETVANKIQEFIKKAQLICIPPEGAVLGDFEQ